MLSRVRISFVALLLCVAVQWKNSAASEGGKHIGPESSSTKGFQNFEQRSASRNSKQFYGLRNFKRSSNKGRTIGHGGGHGGGYGGGHIEIHEVVHESGKGGSYGQGLHISPHGGGYGGNAHGGGHEIHVGGYGDEHQATGYGEEAHEVGYGGDPHGGGYGDYKEPPKHLVYTQYYGPRYSPYDLIAPSKSKKSKKTKYGDDPVYESGKGAHYNDEHDKPISHFGGFGGGGSVGYNAGSVKGHGGGKGYGGGGHKGHGGGGYGKSNDGGSHKSLGGGGYGKSNSLELKVLGGGGYGKGHGGGVLKGHGGGGYGKSHVGGGHKGIEGGGYGKSDSLELKAVGGRGGEGKSNISHNGRGGGVHGKDHKSSRGGYRKGQGSRIQGHGKGNNNKYRSEGAEYSDVVFVDYAPSTLQTTSYHQLQSPSNTYETLALRHVKEKQNNSPDVDVSKLPDFYSTHTPFPDTLTNTPAKQT